MSTSEHLSENYSCQDFVDISLDLSKPNTQLIEVEISFTPEKGHVIMSLPIWTPGSYTVRDHVQFLHCLSIKQCGKTLRFERPSPSSWEFIVTSEEKVYVNYTVEARTLSVRTCYLDQEFASLCLPALVLLIKDFRYKGHKLSLMLPPEWKAAIPLQAEENIYIASDYDKLIDAPVHAGDLFQNELNVSTFKHKIIQIGKIPETLPNSFVQDVELICEATSRLLKTPPPSEDAYIFIVLFLDKGYGGLEHDNSCVLHFSNERLVKQSGYRELLQLFGHEYLHQWNIRRLRPSDYYRYNYQLPVTTDTLWFVEGLTSYFDLTLPYIAGLSSVNDLLDDLTNEITRFFNTPARFEHSLLDSSRESWVKLYKSHSSSSNYQISYYNVGTLYCLCLDISLRKLGSSLSFVLRYMWNNFAINAKGYKTSDVFSLISSIDNKLAENAVMWLNTPNTLPLEDLLLEIGYQIVRRKESKCFSGFKVSELHGKFTVKSILKDSPAMSSGFIENDELISFDGFRLADLDSFVKYLTCHDDVEIIYCRRGTIRYTKLNCSKNFQDHIIIKQLPKVDKTKGDLRNLWLKFV
ncbi:PDZ domain-containing protein [Prochlorococcus sp. MIT 1341]|uniref:M61 family metallopeptidase n=1 Tax=Prochlorococcus sp. MIT 1341 TaxID=3096221 RepID=UPI002A7581DE|nr:PDZ domain-containing protein [Prochlorococcus sp. MIT 1341]